jgi:hypothetical protein
MSTAGLAATTELAKTADMPRANISAADFAGPL